jgi:hypothetical protein
MNTIGVSPVAFARSICSEVPGAAVMVDILFLPMEWGD